MSISHKLVFGLALAALVAVLAFGAIPPTVRAQNPSAPDACPTPIKKTWQIKGNCGTTAGTHFLGTTDNQSLILKTNKIERMRLDTAGRIGIGTNTPAHHLSIIGGPLWTSNSWSGALELSNSSAIGWQANNGGQRFGLGQTNGGLYFFRTASNPGTTGNPAKYDMTISDKGYVGIGTTASTYPLEVSGGLKASSAGATGLIVDRFGKVFIRREIGNTLGHLCYIPSDQDLVVISNCGSAAGYVPTIDDGLGYPDTADLVSIAPNYSSAYDDTRDSFAVQKSAAPCDANLFGFISDPKLGADGKQLNAHYLPLALSGSFPARVTLENGAIHRGDPLTSSSKPGYAMKATGACKIIGYALEDATVEGTIQVFAHLGENTAPEVIALRGEMNALKQQNADLAQANASLKSTLASMDARLAALESAAPVTRNTTMQAATGSVP